MFFVDSVLRMSNLGLASAHLRAPVWNTLGTLSLVMVSNQTPVKLRQSKTFRSLDAFVMSDVFSAWQTITIDSLRILHQYHHHSTSSRIRMYVFIGTNLETNTDYSLSRQQIGPRAQH